MGDLVVAVEDEIVGPRLLSQLAVHPRPETQRVRVTDLLGRDQPGPDRTVGVEGLAHRPRR